MRIDEIEARKAEIRGLIGTEGAEFDVDALTEEVRALDAEAAEIRAKAQLENELRNAVSESVKTEIKENKTEEVRKMDFAPNSAEYRDAWLSNLMGREISAEARAAVTGASATIPTETLNKIAMRLKENALLSKIDLMQIPGYVRIPVYSTSADASWTTTASDSADAITYIDLKPYQLIKTIEIGADMDKMSIDAFEAEITKNLANKIESALQKAVIVGTGSTNSQPTGIAATVSTDTGTFTKAGITKADLLKIMGKLPADFQQNAVWIMPNAVKYEVFSIANIDGFAGVAAGIGDHIAGKPVIVDENCIISSADTIFYGDPTHYRMNLGEGVKVARDDSVGFRSNAAVYRGVCQADGQLDMAAAFVRYSRAT